MHPRGRRGLPTHCTSPCCPRQTASLANLHMSPPSESWILPMISTKTAVQVRDKLGCQPSPRPGWCAAKLARSRSGNNAFDRRSTVHIGKRGGHQRSFRPDFGHRRNFPASILRSLRLFYHEVAGTAIAAGTQKNVIPLALGFAVGCLP